MSASALSVSVSRALPLLMACVAASAADAPQPAVAPKPDAKTEAAPIRPDPTAAIVGEGRQVYRQRDVDALVLIAERHRKAKLSPADEDQLRQALARILVAREPLLEALDALPPVLADGKAHDALLLDILDYKVAPADAARPVPGESPRPADASKAPEPRPETDAAARPDAGPVIVSLPPLTQARTLDKLGRRQISLQIALLFPDAAAAKRFEEKAPLIRDAILGYVHQLPASDFAEPDQIAIKKGLQAAISAKLPDFPKDGILIPQLDAGPADAKDDGK